ncbi:MAG: hypothetical protein AUJ76_02875 [Candidatus Omnitrophica bacterium CG1_02_41_171]|nr:MAG: hypothetical protein AUJ76_02875 [Candidatus Omnitrophica bacterium CG1_02_41_171]
MSKRTKIISGIVATLLIMFPFSLYAEAKGKYERDKSRYYVTHYKDPTWLNNEEILFLKTVTHRKFNYGLNPFTNIINNWANTPEYSAIRTDYYICSMKTDGTDERIIKQFARIYDRHGIKAVKEVMVEDGKEIPVEEIIYLSNTNCFPKKDLISLSSEKGNIYIMKKDGSNLEKIAKGVSPHFSPDGSKILYKVFIQYRNPKYEGAGETWQDPKYRQLQEAGEPHWITERSLWVMNSDGTNKYKVIDNPPGVIRYHPTENKIYYSTENIIEKGESEYTLWLIDTDTLERTKITDVSQCNVSPDGKRITYTTRDKSHPFILWIANADGTNKKKISEDSWGEGLWNPEGDKLTFNLYGKRNTYYIYNVETDKIESHVKLPRDERLKGYLSVGTSLIGWLPKNKWLTNNYIYDVNSGEKTSIKIKEEGDLKIGGECFWSPDHRKVIVEGSKRIWKEKEGKITYDCKDSGWYLVEEDGACKLLLRE